MFERALVAVDLAEDWAELKSRLDGLLRLGTRCLSLVHAVSPGFPVAAERRYRAEKQRQLDDAVLAVRAIGFDADGLLMVGDTALCLDKAMERTGADFLVAGFRPHGPLRELITGNAVMDLARNAARAVWLEPLFSEPRPRGGGVLLASDGSPAASAAEHAARELLSRYGRGVIVWVKPGKWHIAESGASEETVQAHLRGLADNLPGMELEILAGDPAKVIREQAEQRSSDVVVIGKRGHNPVASLLLGRTAERLCRQMPCPLLLVPGASPAEQH